MKRKIVVIRCSRSVDRVGKWQDTELWETVWVSLWSALLSTGLPMRFSIMECHLSMLSTL